MTTSTELDNLLNSLIDGSLNIETATQLQLLLRNSAEARRRYRDTIAMHASLQWDYVAAVKDRVEPLAATAHGTRQWWIPVSSAIAALLLVVIGFFVLRSPAVFESVTVASVSGGNLSWSNNNTAPHAVAVNDQLSAGRYALEGDSAIASLRFEDGTVLTLTGDTELVVSAMGQKNLHLLRGIVAANVQPQPPGKPLLIRTATAQLQVIGTKFIVASNDAGTALDVEHGRVRVERLADGQAVDVATQQTTTVTLDVSADLRSSERQAPPTSWAVNFSQPPPSHWRGLWRAPSGDKMGSFTSVPYVAGRTEQDKPIIHHGLYIRANEAWSRPFVRFTKSSVVSMRFRVAATQQKSRISVMVCSHTDMGAFGGTFFATINVSEYPPDTAGWRTVSLSMDDFIPTRPQYPQLVNRDAIFILPHSVSAKVELEIADLAVTSL